MSEALSEYGADKGLGPIDRAHHHAIGVLACKTRLSNNVRHDLKTLNKNRIK